MKKILILIIYSLYFLFFAFQGEIPLMGQKQQENNHKPIIEEVTVTNVEVPVRVLNKGKPVSNLTKQDFILYENKKKQKIHGFFLKKKKIELNTVQKKSPINEQKITPRTFVLIFSITDYNKNLIKAIEHLFAHTFFPTDRLLIFVNDKRLEYENLNNKDEIKQLLLSEAKKESIRARSRLSIYINKIETYLNIYDFVRELETQRNNPVSMAPQKLISFLKKYLQTWIDYKLKYLTPRLDRFYYFSRYLEEVKGNKWVLNFYQFDLFPNIRMSSKSMDIIRTLAMQLMNSSEAGAHAMGKMVYSILNQIELELNVNRGFPIEEVTKLFYKVDATFHSFFIRSMKKLSAGDLEYQEISSDIERILKSITDITGGKNITSNNLVQSIDTISEIEDVYYILTYVPQNPKKAGKLKIRVKNKKYNVMYDDNFRADYISDYLNKLEEKIQVPKIKIEDLSFKGKILAFTIKDFMMKTLEQDKELMGKMKIRIRLNNSKDSPLFDQAKILTADKNQLKISLNTFKGIKEGDYQFIIDATDLFTGKKTSSFHNVSIKR